MLPSLDREYLARVWMTLARGVVKTRPGRGHHKVSVSGPPNVQEVGGCTGSACWKVICVEVTVERWPR